jgi:preprotein translocase subunit YajC
MMSLDILLAQTGDAPKRGPGGFDGTFLIMMVAIFLVFYFFMIRPQKKREKARQEMIAQVGKGAKVRTIGGLHGEVVNAKEDYVILKVDTETGTKLKVSRRAISGVVGDEGEGSQE